MKFLLSLSIFSLLSAGLLAQDIFQVQGAASNSYTTCENESLIFSFEYSNAPDSFYLSINGAKVVDDKFKLTRQTYTFQTQLPAGTYNPTLNIYRDNNLSIESLPQSIKILQSPDLALIPNLTKSSFDSIAQIQQFVLDLQNTGNSSSDSISHIELHILEIESPSDFLSRDTVLQSSFEQGSDGLINLNDTIHFALGNGKYIISLKATVVSGCTWSTQSEVTVGQFSRFRIDNACAGAPTKFYDSVYYWQPTIICEIRSWFENTSCIDTSRYFANESGRPRAANSAAELVAWDFENDGVIDTLGNNPEHIYKSGGLKTVAMWSRDSLGMWQVVRETINIPALDLSLKLDDNQSEYVCAGQEIKLKNRSTFYGDSIIDMIILGERRIVNLNKDTAFSIILQGDPKSSPLIEALHSKGCLDSFNLSDIISFFGPSASFTLNSPLRGCEAFKIEASNHDDTSDTHFLWNLEGPENHSYLAEGRDFKHNSEFLGQNQLILTASDSVLNPGNNEMNYCQSTYASPKIDVIPFEKPEFEYSETSNGVSIFNLKNLYVQQTYSYRIDSTDTGSISNIDNSYKLEVQNLKAGDHEFCLKHTLAGCQAEFCYDFTIRNTSLEPLEEFEISVFPNPASTYLVIQVEKFKAEPCFRLYSPLGKIVREGNLQTLQTQVSVSQLSGGLYLLEIQSGKSSAYRKIMIED